MKKIDFFFQKMEDIQQVIRKLPLLIIDKLFCYLDPKSIRIFSLVTRLNTVRLCNLFPVKYNGIFDFYTNDNIRYKAYMNAIKSNNWVGINYYKIDFMGFPIACSTNNLQTIKYFENQLKIEIFNNLKENQPFSKHFELYSYAFDLNLKIIEKYLTREKFNEILKAIDMGIFVLFKKKSTLVKYFWNRSESDLKKLFREKIRIIVFTSIQNIQNFNMINSIENYVSKVLVCAKNLGITKNLHFINNLIDEEAIKQIFIFGKSILSDFYSKILTKDQIIRGIDYYYCFHTDKKLFENTDYFCDLVGPFELAKSVLVFDDVFRYIFEKYEFSQLEIDKLFLAANKCSIPEYKTIKMIYDKKPANVIRSYMAFLVSHEESSAEIHEFYVDIMTVAFLNGNLDFIIEHCFQAPALRLLYEKTTRKDEFYGFLCIKHLENDIIREFDDIAKMDYATLRILINEGINEDLFEYFATKFYYSNEEKIVLLDLLEFRGKTNHFKILFQTF